MTTFALYEEHGSDWSHQVFAVATKSKWLQRDQTLPLSAKGVACKTRQILLLSSPPTETVPAASMVDIYIYIYTEANMLLQFNVNRHMHSLRKVATFYRQEGRAWEQG